MKKELIQEIENRFQLVIVMSLFFPSFLSAFGSAIEQPIKEASVNFIGWSGFAAFYLMSYVSLQFFKKRENVSELFLRFLSWLSLLVILSFAVAMLIATISIHQKVEPDPASWSVILFTFIFKASLHTIVFGGIVPLLAMAPFLFVGKKAKK